MILLQRIFFAAAILFLAAGEALHLNAFIQNGIDIGLPYARIITTGVVIAAFLASIMILFGFAFRFGCVLCGLVCLFSAFFFFAGNFNKVNLLGIAFVFVILTGFLFRGPGKISLAYWAEQRRIKNNKRIAFR